MDSVAVAPAQKDAFLGHVQKPGCWEPIENVNDSYTQEMGRFAVMEQPMPPLVESMEFMRVVKGETQVVAGKKYRLVVEVKVVEKILVHGCPVSFIKFYVATVLDKPWEKSWKVLSFEPLEPPCPCPPGPIVKA